MSDKMELANTKDCFDVNFMVLTTFGVWVPSQYLGTRKELLYKLFSLVFVGFCFYAFILLELINLAKMLDDVDSVVKATFLMLTHLAQLHKTLNTIVRRSRIGKLFDTLEDVLFNEVNADFIPSVRASVKSVRRVTVVLCSLVASTVALWAVFPFLEDEVKLPIVEWSPFDTSYSNVRFGLMFAYQIVATMINGLSNACQDTLISGSMALACMQLDILDAKLRDKKGQFLPLTEQDGKTCCDIIVKNEEIEKHLHNCIEHHQAIIRFVDEAWRIFGIPVLIQFGATSFIICVVAFKMTTLPFSVELVSMVLYMACMLTEVFLYCYHGNELIIKSRDIMEAAYESVWYEQSVENRRLVFMLMERSKRPLRVAALIFDLSIPTFMSILKSSYSYFALLRQMDN